MSETVLITTLGTEPQVVTLALDALLASGEAISRVVVVHTHADSGPIHESLVVLRRVFLTEQHYGDRVLFVPHLLTATSGPLADIVSAEEMEEAFHCMYALLRQHKHAGHYIHLSIAGGRKTMALFAMAAAQILFEARDRVWHVVSDAGLVASDRLHAGLDDTVTLVPVPVAYWNGLRSDAPNRAQTFLESSLTPAERELAELLAREGLSNAELASRLDKSPSTIANQLTRIYEKLSHFFDLSAPADRATLLVLLGRSPM